MVISLLRIVHHVYHPETGVLILNEHKTWDFIPPVPGAVTEPGLVLYRFGAALFYANARQFAKEVSDLGPSVARVTGWWWTPKPLPMWTTALRGLFAGEAQLVAWESSWCLPAFSGPESRYGPASSYGGYRCGMDISAPAPSEVGVCKTL